jgi:serine phosphatase RsbU (regulator of sigma subunit)
VHPDDLSHVSAALRAAIDACGVYEAEFRVRRPDGTTVWLVARGRAVAGPSGRAEQLIGVTTDTTAMRSGEQRVGQILEGMTVGYFRLGPDWRFTYVNAEAERILARPRQELVGGVVWDLFPAAVRTTFEDGYRRVARTGEPAVFDAYYPEPLDAWYEVRAVPESGGVAVYFTDVTTSRRALADSERAQQRLQLLARVAGELAEALDPVGALAAVLPILVPQVADFAIASVLHEGHAPWQQRLHDVAAHHGDPGRQGLLEDFRALRVPALTQRSPVARALATGRPASAVDAGASRPGEILAAGPAHDLLARLAPHATVVLPLRGRGHTRGLITLSTTGDRGAFGADDLTTVREAVAQVGLALDNLHLHATRREFVEELQASLLTDLPQPDHLHLVARYVPAASGTRIGGDWYDAFPVRDGSTCLVIGDVTGHDLGAAVAMAQIRNVLRGSAHAVVQPPAAILGSLDWAMHDLGVDVLSTAILAKVEQTDELAARGLRLLRWSNAGHLPPLVIHADGRTELLSRPADMLLGVGPHQERRDHDHLIEPSSTVILYTDGLVERRGEHLTRGLDRLQQVARTLAGLPLDELCDRLIAELAGGSEDDVALLAVRAHPEDRPRPPEAGPARPRP